MGRAPGSPDAWLEREVRDLLAHYRAAGAVDETTATTVERYLDRGATEAALHELVDGAGS